LSKIIFLILAVLLVYWILKAYRRRIDRREDSAKTGAEEDMVRCQHCGVHLPRSESLTARGHFYCSADHQRQHLRSD